MSRTRTIGLCTLLIITLVAADRYFNNADEYKQGFNSVKKIIQYESSDNSTATIESEQQWLDHLTQARNSLTQSIQLKINNFDESVYDIEKFEKGKYSIIADGNQIGNTAYITYTFQYTDNFMITTAIEKPELSEKLSAEQLQIIEQLKSIQTQIITGQMTDYQKELAIHDYFAKNYCYNQKALDSNFITNSSTELGAFLQTKTGVCEAYAFAFKALCNLSGIECYVVTGTMDGMPHAWNVVKIEDAMYHVDVTSDDPVPDEPNHCYYTYFNLSDEEILKTHIPENKWYECNSSTHNYFVYNNLVVDSNESLKAVVNKQLSEGKTTILFKTKAYKLTDTIMNEMFSNKGFSSYQIVSDNSTDNQAVEIRLK